MLQRRKKKIKKRKYNKRKSKKEKKCNQENERIKRISTFLQEVATTRKSPRGPGASFFFLFKYEFSFDC